MGQCWDVYVYYVHGVFEYYLLNAVTSSFIPDRRAQRGGGRKLGEQFFGDWESLYSQLRIPRLLPYVPAARSDLWNIRFILKCILYQRT